MRSCLCMQTELRAGSTQNILIRYILVSVLVRRQRLHSLLKAKFRLLQNAQRQSPSRSAGVRRTLARISDRSRVSMSIEAKSSWSSGGNRARSERGQTLMGSCMHRSARNGESEGRSGEDRCEPDQSAGMSLRLGGVRKTAQWNTGA